MDPNGRNQGENSDSTQPARDRRNCNTAEQNEDSGSPAVGEVGGLGEGEDSEKRFYRFGKLWNSGAAQTFMWGKEEDSRVFAQVGMDSSAIY